MFDHDDLPIDMDLRSGLQGLPVRSVSRDFDVQVLHAVLHTTRLERFLIAARPILSGAVCSLILALALIHWSVQSGAAPTKPRPAESIHYNEPGFDSTDLQAGELARFLYRIQPAAQIARRDSNS